MKDLCRRLYEFIDGDDQKLFLHECPPHILYLWHLAYTYDILNDVHQQLRNDCIIDGSNVPSVASIHKKSPESNDSSVITNNLSNSIQQIADSMNGLV